MDENNKRLQELLKGKKIEDVPTITIVFTMIAKREDAIHTGGICNDQYWTFITDEGGNLLGKVETSLSLILSELNDKIKELLIGGK